MKNEKVILILVIILAGAFYFNQQKPEPFGMKIHYYDKQGNEIDYNPQSSFSIFKNLKDVMNNMFSMVQQTKNIEHTENYQLKYDCGDGEYHWYKGTSTDYHFYGMEIGWSDFSQGRVYKAYDYFPTSSLPYPINIIDLEGYFYLYDVEDDHCSGREAVHIFEGEGIVHGSHGIDPTPDNEKEYEEIYHYIGDGEMYVYELYEYFDESDDRAWISADLGHDADDDLRQAIRENDPFALAYSAHSRGGDKCGDDCSIEIGGSLHSRQPSYIKVTYEYCLPYTCPDLGHECGTWDDSCGGTIDCGTCESGECVDGQCVPSIDSFSFEIIVENAEAIQNVRIFNATPIEFQNALNLNDQRILKEGESTIYYSENISASNFIGETTIFEIQVEGINEYLKRELPPHDSYTGCAYPNIVSCDYKEELDYVGEDYYSGDCSLNQFSSCNSQWKSKGEKSWGLIKSDSIEIEI